MLIHPVAAEPVSVYFVDADNMRLTELTDPNMIVQFFDYNDLFVVEGKGVSEGIMRITTPDVGRITTARSIKGDMEFVDLKHKSGALYITVGSGKLKDLSEVGNETAGIGYVSNMVLRFMGTHTKDFITQYTAQREMSHSSTGVLGVLTRIADMLKAIDYWTTKGISRSIVNWLLYDVFVFYDVILAVVFFAYGANRKARDNAPFAAFIGGIYYCLFWIVMKVSLSAIYSVSFFTLFFLSPEEDIIYVPIAAATIALFTISSSLFFLGRRRRGDVVAGY